VTTAEVERQLQSLAHAADWPPTRDLSVAVAVAIAAPGRPQRLPRRRPLVLRPAVVAAATILVIAVGILVVSPAAREAVASWLGIPGIEIRVQETPSADPPAAQLRLGEPTTLSNAQARVAFDIGELDLDAPVERLGGGVYFDDRAPGGIVHIVYPEQEGLPVAAPKGVGAVFTQFAAARDDPFFTKEVADAEDGVVTPTTVAGEFALWVQGPSHILIPNRNGVPIRHESRLSANALLWTADGVTYRLETALDVEDAVALAETIR
jgi:hypothetical protein